jgi:hypothetical protein
MQQTGQETTVDPAANKGELIVDATACPQNINYPTDLNLLNDARGTIRKVDRHLIW